MAAPLTHTIPQQVRVGDSIEFLQSIPGDLVVGWTGSARLIGPSKMDATSVATENTDFHVYFKGIGGTDALTPGQYSLIIAATNGNDRYTVGQYRLSLLKNLLAAGATTDQSHAATMLGLIETAIQNRISGNSDGGIDEYELEGTRVKKIPMLELQRLHVKYSAIVAREQNPNAPMSRVKIAFTPSGFVGGGKGRYA